jgi:hypothetical protein
MSSIVSRQEWPTVLRELETSVKRCQECASIAWQTWHHFGTDAKKVLPLEACAEPFVTRSQGGLSMVYC